MWHYHYPMYCLSKPVSFSFKPVFLLIFDVTYLAMIVLVNINIPALYATFRSKSLKLARLV